MPGILHSAYEGLSNSRFKKYQSPGSARRTCRRFATSGCGAGLPMSTHSADSGHVKNSVNKLPTCCGGCAWPIRMTSVIRHVCNRAVFELTLPLLLSEYSYCSRSVESIPKVVGLLLPCVSRYKYSNFRPAAFLSAGRSPGPAHPGRLLDWGDEGHGCIAALATLQAAECTSMGGVNDQEQRAPCVRKNVIRKKIALPRTRAGRRAQTPARSIAAGQSSCGPPSAGREQAIESPHLEFIH